MARQPLCALSGCSILITDYEDLIQDMTEKLIQAMNCMNSTTYRFLKAHVEKLFLSRRKNISYVWAQIFRNITGRQSMCEHAYLFPHWEKLQSDRGALPLCTIPSHFRRHGNDGYRRSE